MISPRHFNAVAREMTHSAVSQGTTAYISRSNSFVSENDPSEKSPDVTSPGTISISLSVENDPIMESDSKTPDTRVSRSYSIETGNETPDAKTPGGTMLRSRKIKKDDSIFQTNMLKYQQQKLFQHLQDEDCFIPFSNFAKFIIEEQKLNYSDAEVERLWSQILPPPCQDSKMSDDERKLTFEDFRSATKQWIWLKNIVSSYAVVPVSAYTVSTDYDYSKSTNANYASKSGEEIFTAPYAGLC